MLVQQGASAVQVGMGDMNLESERERERESLIEEVL